MTAASCSPSDYTGHRLTFLQFAQAPHSNHLNAVYNAFDFSGPLDFVKRAAGLSDRVDRKHIQRSAGARGRPRDSAASSPREGLHRLERILQEISDEAASRVPLCGERDAVTASGICA